jgi:hypothetical protein
MSLKKRDISMVSYLIFNRQGDFEKLLQKPFTFDKHSEFHSKYILYATKKTYYPIREYSQLI